MREVGLPPGYTDPGREARVSSEAARAAYRTAKMKKYRASVGVFGVKEVMPLLAWCQHCSLDTGCWCDQCELNGATYFTVTTRQRMRGSPICTACEADTNLVCKECGHDGRALITEPGQGLVNDIDLRPFLPPPGPAPSGN